MIAKTLSPTHSTPASSALETPEGEIEDALGKRVGRIAERENDRIAAFKSPGDFLDLAVARRLEHRARALCHIARALRLSVSGLGVVSGARLRRSFPRGFAHCRGGARLRGWRVKGSERAFCRRARRTGRDAHMRGRGRGRGMLARRLRLARRRLDSEFSPSERVGREAAAATAAEPSGVIVGAASCRPWFAHRDTGCAPVVMRRALDVGVLDEPSPREWARTSMMDTRFEMVEFERALRVVTRA